MTGDWYFSSYIQKIKRLFFLKLNGLTGMKFNANSITIVKKEKLYKLINLNEFIIEFIDPQKSKRINF